MRKTKFVFLFVILLISFFLVYKNCVRPYVLTDRFIKSERYLNTVRNLTADTITDRTILLIGNSLTVGYSVSDFSEYIIKWAIKGDVMEGLHWRKNALRNKKPKAIIINLGINDILNGYGYSDQALYSFVSALKESSPATKIYLMSLSPERLTKGLFTSPERIAVEIVEANLKIQAFCNAHSLTYIDVYSPLEKTGKLKAECTYDGLHLTAAGYEIWTREIKKHINLIP